MSKKPYILFLKILFTPSSIKTLKQFKPLLLKYSWLYRLLWNSCRNILSMSIFYYKFYKFGARYSIIRYFLDSAWVGHQYFDVYNSVLMSRDSIKYVAVKIDLLEFTESEDRLYFFVRWWSVLYLIGITDTSLVHWQLCNIIQLALTCEKFDLSLFLGWVSNLVYCTVEGLDKVVEKDLKEFWIH